MSWTMTTTDDEITVARSGAPAIDPARFGVESVVVAGGSIDVAILDESNDFDPSLPFAIRLHSPEIALEWLPFVIGDEATEAVLTRREANNFAPGPVNDPAMQALLTGTVSPVEIEFGHLTTVIQRFALGTWMQRWWVPADWAERSAESPSEWLLDAELGTLAYDGAALFASYGVADVFLANVGVPLAEDLVVRANDFPARVAPRSEDVPEVLASDHVATVLAAAATAVLDREILPSPADDALIAAESEYWDIREGEKVVQTYAELEQELTQVFVVKSWAPMMGGAERKSPIDPFEVHPRSLRAGVLRWQFKGDALHVEIESPEPGSISLGDGELFARVQVGNETYAIPLDPTERGYAGERRIENALRSPLDRIKVSVYSDRFSAGGRTGRPEEEVRATRGLLQRFAQARAELATSARPSSHLTRDPAAPFAVELKYLEG